MDEKAKYLGHEIDDIPIWLSRDITYKRARYIERNMELNQNFSLAHREFQCKLNGIYCQAQPQSKPSWTVAGFNSSFSVRPAGQPVNPIQNSTF